MSNGQICIKCPNPVPAPQRISRFSVLCFLLSLDPSSVKLQLYCHNITHFLIKVQLCPVINIFSELLLYCQTI